MNLSSSLVIVFVWQSRGVERLLYALGSFGMSQQMVFGDAVVWVGRISTYIGLLYFLYALVGSRKK
jgi:hypothetical protein